MKKLPKKILKLLNKGSMKITQIINQIKQMMVKAKARVKRPVWAKARARVRVS